MKFVSTRDSKKEVSASEAIVKGISSDGGLFVPSSFPFLSMEEISKLAELDYAEKAAKILSLYLEEFTYDELLSYAKKAYSRFEENVCPVSKIEDGLYILELWHGPTCAFKDFALTLLPYLLVASKKKIGKEDKTLILVATSGDTGKAALAGFKDVEGTEIIVFYPSTGVSEMQKLQMVTQEGNNVHVAGIKGNFDDAQTAVKKVFNDQDIIAKLKEKNIEMSSANSINFGRLAPQIAYYFSAYCDLVESEEIKLGDQINFVVPTGNFGDILAGYYAKKMGLPVNKLIIASNTNKILTDFFNTGIYDTNREFFKTASPSMDILVSSNLERLLYEVLGHDDAKVNKIYDDLKKTGKFEINLDEVDLSSFEAGWADEEETKEAIFNFFDLDDYIMDTHTAVAASVYDDYSCETEDATPTVVLSTASPYKFSVDVLAAIGGKEKDPFKALVKLQNATALECPESLSDLQNKEKRHLTVIEKDEIFNTVLTFVE